MQMAPTIAGARGLMIEIGLSFLFVCLGVAVLVSAYKHYMEE